MVRTKVMLMVALVAITTLTGCFTSASGPGGETTCREWLALRLPIEEELIGGKRSEEQEDIIKKALADRGVDADFAGNNYVARMQIDEFCGKYDPTVERMNADKPIDDALN